MATRPIEFVLGQLASSRVARAQLPLPRHGRAVTALRFALPHAAPGAVRVTNEQGISVRTLLAPTLPAGEVCAQWDGLDDLGVRVPRGNYALRVEVEARVIASRVVTIG